MTSEEMQELARRIAEILSRSGWVPGPVRPEPPGRPTPGQLPPWAAAAQRLGDVAPVPGRRTPSGGHRPAYDAIIAAARAAAAGRGPSPLTGGHAASRSGPVGGRTVPVAISARHVHITQVDFERLFGSGKQLTPERPISQPGQFAARETVSVTGPRGTIEGIRLVGPTRQATQVEVSAADCRLLGLSAPVRHSGHVDQSAAITVTGPAGSVALAQGAIIAARHIHVAAADAARLGVADGDRVTVVLGPVHRRATLPDVLIRSGAAHATEMHLDTDEAHAFGVSAGDQATIVGRPERGKRPPATAAKRPLLTERGVDAVAARGETLSDASPYLMTPSAKDRARALGIWRPA